jgi:hypothetical protein
MRISSIVLGMAAGVALAGVARAESATSFGDAAPSAREVQSSVDAYLASSKATGNDASLVGGPGQAGYDGGFWIRGGSFLVKINLTLQARWEGFDWKDSVNEATPGGDLSGFSLPRTTLKFSGDATCSMHYYAELEFGHAGAVMPMMANPPVVPPPMMWMPGMVEFMEDPGILREAWIEYETCPQFAVRMGLVKTAATRQLMTPPEMQQFVDISLAAASVGSMMPGYTDRNRDYGVAFHGALGCDGAVSYLLTITNGDGPWHRNVLDGMTNDNYAYSGRVNWDIKGHVGYEECALNQHECEWRLAVGAWADAYANVTRDRKHFNAGEWWSYGVDAAGGYGGFTFCAAYSIATVKNGDPGFVETESACWCAQAGYLFPGTAWEIAARYSLVTMDMGTGLAKMTEGAHEYGFAINYFIDGHANKLTLDASFIQADDLGNFFGDVYTGYEPTGTGDGTLVRFQWQLAL